MTRAARTTVCRIYRFGCLVTSDCWDGLMRKSAGLVLAVVVLVFSLAAKPTPRTSFSDNLNDRNLAGLVV